MATETVMVGGWNKLISSIKTNSEPRPDRAECEDCHWEGAVSECVKEREGDWESGYFLIDTCPICGGPIEYSLSEGKYERSRRDGNSHGKR